MFTMTITPQRLSKYWVTCPGPYKKLSLGLESKPKLPDSNSKFILLIQQTLVKTLPQSFFFQFPFLPPLIQFFLKLPPSTYHLISFFKKVHTSCFHNIHCCNPYNYLTSNPPNYNHCSQVTNDLRSNSMAIWIDTILVFLQNSFHPGLRYSLGLSSLLSHWLFFPVWSLCEFCAFLSNIHSIHPPTKVAYPIPSPQRNPNWS